MKDYLPTIEIEIVHFDRGGEKEMIRVNLKILEHFTYICAPIYNDDVSVALIKCLNQTNDLILKTCFKGDKR